MYEIKIHDVEDLWKLLMQTWFDLNQDIIDTTKTSSVAIKDMCVLVVDTLDTCSDVNVHYVIHQNILWNCQWNLMHVTAIL